MSIEPAKPAQQASSQEEPGLPAERARTAERSRSRRWATTAALILILALALVLRLYELDHRSAWLDELWSMAITAGRALETSQPTDVVIDPPPPSPTSLEGAAPWWRVWSSTKETTHPPLYYVVLRLWREAVGESQAAARGMSVAFSLAAVLLMYELGRSLGGRPVGLWSALLMAVAVPQVVNAQEVRNYTMQLALALAAALAVVRIERRGASPGRLAWLALALISLMLTHYFSLGFAIGLLAYALLRLRGSARRRALGAFVVAAILFAAAWGPSMWEQRAEFAVSAADNNWLYDASPGRAWRAFKQALLVPAQLLCPLDEQTAALGYLGAALYVLPVILWRKRPDLHLPLLWLAGVVGMLLVMDAARSSLHLVHLRYSFIASPAVYLLLAVLLRPMRWLAHVLPAIAALSCILPLKSHYSEAHVDWRWPAGGLEQSVQPGEVILFSSAGGPDYQAFATYFALAHYMGELPGPIALAPHPPGEALLADLRRRGKPVWLVTGVGWVDHEQIMPGWRVDDRLNYYLTVDIWRMTPDEPSP